MRTILRTILRLILRPALARTRAEGGEIGTWHTDPGERRFVNGYEVRSRG